MTSEWLGTILNLLLYKFLIHSFSSGQKTPVNLLSIYSPVNLGSIYLPVSNVISWLHVSPSGLRIIFWSTRLRRELVAELLLHIWRALFDCGCLHIQIPQWHEVRLSLRAQWLLSLPLRHKDIWATVFFQQLDALARSMRLNFLSFR